VQQALNNGNRKDDYYTGDARRHANGEHDMRSTSPRARRGVATHIAQAARAANAIVALSPPPAEFQGFLPCPRRARYAQARASSRC